MKKVIILSFMAILAISCEKEELDESITSEDVSQITTKRGGSVPLLNQQEHKDMLAYNSFIIGEVMRLDPADRNFVLSFLGPDSNSVSMSTLLSEYSNANNNFYNHYLFVARHAIMNYNECRVLGLEGNPDGGNPWPPQSEWPIEPAKSIPTEPELIDLLNNLIANRTEIMVYNPSLNSDIYTVGHPLTDQLTHTGSMVIYAPVLTHSVNMSGQMIECGVYSLPASVSPSNQAAGDMIIMSRPDLSKNNPYSYIDFDIELYLDTSPPDEIPGM